MPTVLDTPNGIQYFQLASLKGAVKLESIGLRHSSKFSARKQACKTLGLPLRAPYDLVIKALSNKLQELLLETSHGSRNNPNA